MGRKKSKKKGYLFVTEGHNEECFLYRMKELYTIDKQKIRLNIVNQKGGNPDSIIISACRKKDTANFTYVLLDNDKPMQSNNEELRQAWGIGNAKIKDKRPSKLNALNDNNRNPILIVSEPWAFENTLLDLFSIKATANNTRDLKIQVENNLGKDWDKKIDRLMLKLSTNPVIQKLVAIFQQMETISRQ